MKVTNKRALFDYEVLESWDAGVVLTGAEVKSAKKGSISMNGARVILGNSSEEGAEELWVVGMQINPYENAPAEEYDPIRTRKLLLRREEIEQIRGKVAQKGLTLVPLRCYTKGSLVKIEIGLVRGKKEYEKREVERKRDAQREILNAIKIGGKIGRK